MVIVDEPQGGHLGGAVAAPIFKEIAEQALRYLHVPPHAPIAAEGGGQAGGARRPRPAAARDGRRRPTRAASEAPATDLPLDERRAGRRSGAGREVGRGRGRRGRPGGAAARRAGRRARLRGAEPRAGDPRRAQERRRAGLRRSGRACDRRGASPAAGARPGTAGCGLPRGVRAQGMTAPRVHARGLAEGHRRRARARRRGRRDRRGARRFAAGRAAAICSSRCPGTVVDGRRFLDGRGRARARRRWWSRASRRPSWRLRARVAAVPSARRALGVIARNRYRAAAGAGAVRRDRDQRQDHDYVYRRGDAARGGPVAGRRRDGLVPRPGRAGRRAAGAEHHAGGADAARAVRRNARRGRDRRRVRSDFARARAGAGCRLRLPRGGDDQPDAGPPRLSRRHAALRRREGDPVRTADRSGRAASR